MVMICGLPAELPFGHSPFGDFARYEQAERRHKEALKAHLIAYGWDGEHTGMIFRKPWADGYAQYMVAEEKGGRVLLVHLPYMDGWHDPDVEYLPASRIIENAERNEKIAAICEGRPY